MGSKYIFKNKEYRQFVKQSFNVSDLGQELHRAALEKSEITFKLQEYMGCSDE
jgi:hypothetical protein